jgi:hypothetical protein
VIEQFKYGLSLEATGEVYRFQDLAIDEEMLPPSLQSIFTQGTPVVAKGVTESRQGILHEKQQSFSMKSSLKQSVFKKSLIQGDEDA